MTLGGGERPTGTNRAPRTAHALSRQSLSQVLQQSIEHLVSTPSAVELPQQPRPPRGRHPHAFHRDARGAALEIELEVGLRAATVDDLDPSVGGGGFVLDDLDDGVGFAALALEVDAVAVASAVVGGSRD